MTLPQEMRPGAAPQFARRLFLWTAAAGGEDSCELESRNNGRAYSPSILAALGNFIMKSFCFSEGLCTDSQRGAGLRGGQRIHASSASSTREPSESKWRPAMASGIVGAWSGPWSCFSCRRFVSRSAESLSIPGWRMEGEEAHRR